MPYTHFSRRVCTLLLVTLSHGPLIRLKSVFEMVTAESEFFFFLPDYFARKLWAIFLMNDPFSAQLQIHIQ